MKKFVTSVERVVGYDGTSTHSVIVPESFYTLNGVHQLMKMAVTKCADWRDAHNEYAEWDVFGDIYFTIDGEMRDPETFEVDACGVYSFVSDMHGNNDNWIAYQVIVSDILE